MSARPGDATEDAPMDFERWLDLTARMLARSVDERELVLESADVNSDTWDAAERHWLEVITNEVLGAGGPRSDAYAKRCADEMREREAIAKRPPPKRGEAALPAFAPQEETAQLPEGLLALARALPFAPSGSDPKPRPTPPRAPRAPADSQGDTAHLPEDLVRAAAALPFRSGAPAASSGEPPDTPRSRVLRARGGASLTLQQFASFSVELAEPGANAGEILRKYQISAMQHADLGAAWEAMKKRDEGAEAEWDDACRTFRVWLAQQGRAR